MATFKRLTIGGKRIRIGTVADINLKVSESYAGDPVSTPVHVRRARKAGPTVFVTAAVHGDEINGTGIIRELLFGQPLDLISGTLICLPVVNTLGFESHDRYMPDRRDLNRSFPGSARGSMASRVADTLFREIVCRSNFGIDLHTAAVRRTNFPNIRADLGRKDVRGLAQAFGCELIVNDKGPANSLRRAATEAGCPTLVFEGGEVWKIEPGIVAAGVRGVRNVLIALGMLGGPPLLPTYQTRIDRSTWVRAEVGGLLRFHVGPGDLLEAGQPIATSLSVIGDERSILIAPVDGIVLGMTTMPSVKPGEPVCHLAMPRRSLASIRQRLIASAAGSLHERLRTELATSVAVQRLGRNG